MKKFQKDKEGPSQGVSLSFTDKEIECQKVIQFDAKLKEDKCDYY